MDQNKLFQIFGTKELVEAFEGLDLKVQNKVINTSLKKVAPSYSSIVLSETLSPIIDADGNLYTEIASGTFTIL